MCLTIKRTLLYVLATVSLIMILPIFQAGSAYAASPLELDKTDITFDVVNFYYGITVHTTGASGAITGASSSNEAVATIDKYDSGSVSIAPEDEGSCIITVTGEAGDTVKVNVTVDSSWTQEALEDQSYVSDGGYYGIKSITIDTLPYASGVLKIGTDTYTFTANKQGISGQATVKLKKVYKLGTKYTVTLTKNSSSCTMSGGKIVSYTSIGKAKVNKRAPKKIKIDIDTPHKGDVVKLTYKGKTYSKTIKKNYGIYDTVTVTFKVKNKFTKSSAMKVKVLNKYKQKLAYCKVKLTNWKFTPYGD